MATMRLVAESGLKAGRYQTGIDLVMLPGSHTYWKDPGEAGVPPVFSFNGSRNVKTADVSYPAPSRLTEDGLETFGYVDRVVFPVIVTPDDASKPSTLHVDVTFAVCNHICVPGHDQADLVLDPNGPGVSPELVAKALARVPRKVAASPDLRIAEMSTSTTPSWALTWTGAPALTDIFPVAPEGYDVTTKKTGPDSWRLTATQSVTTPKAAAVPVTLVLVGPGDAIETTRTFDLASPGRR